MHDKAAIIIGILLIVMPMEVLGSQPEERTIHTFLSPFYRASMTNNNDYNWSVSINPPDGISSVMSAIVAFDIYLNPSVNFTIKANGIPCNTYFFYVSTTYASAGQSRVTFDCSNIINKKGNYVITLRPSGANTGSVSGWLDMTYMNRPFGNMNIQGTEYTMGQNGTLFLKLLDSNELPINNGFCSITMYYPNKTMKFMDNSPTTFLENGLYYKDFFVPTIEGLYIADASCIYDDNIYRYNLPSENCGYDGAIVGGTSPQPLTFSDVDCTPFHTSVIGNYQNWTFNYTSIGLINLSEISQIDVNWVGQIGQTGNLQLYNFNTSTWNNIGTSVASTGVTVACGNNVYITRSMTTNITSYVRNNTIKARTIVPIAAILTDSVEIIFHNNGSVIANLRGSSEVHVNNWVNQTQYETLLTAINSVNATVNTTVIDKLDNISDYLAAHNSSIYGLLVAMNGSCYNNTQRIIDYIDQHDMNITTLLENLNTSIINSSINVSMDIDELYRRVRNIVFTQTEPVRLEAQQKIVEAGFVPAVTAQPLNVFNSTCVDNMTLRQFYVESTEITDNSGTDWLNTTRHLDYTCAWGCDNTSVPPACSISPLSGAAYFFAFIFIMLLAAGVIYSRRNR